MAQPRERGAERRAELASPGPRELTPASIRLPSSRTQQLRTCSVTVGLLACIPALTITAAERLGKRDAISYSRYHRIALQIDQVPHHPKLTRASGECTIGGTRQPGRADAKRVPSIVTRSPAPIREEPWPGVPMAALVRRSSRARWWVDGNGERRGAHDELPRHVARRSRTAPWQDSATSATPTTAGSELTRRRRPCYGAHEHRPACNSVQALSPSPQHNHCHETNSMHSVNGPPWSPTPATSSSSASPSRWTRPPIRR